MELKLKDALVLFEYHCQYEKNLTDKTLKAYFIDLNQFKDYNSFNDKDIETFTKYDIKDFIKTLYEKGLVAKTIKRKVATLKSFFNFLLYEDIVEVSPFYKLKLAIKVPQILPQIINIKDLKRLFRYVYNYKDTIEDTNTYEYKLLIRDIAVIELLFGTGMRVSELCHLTPKSLSIAQGYVKIYGKGNKERLIKIYNPDLKKALSEYYHIYKDSISKTNYFFINKQGKMLTENSVRYLIDKYRKSCRIKTKITPHHFRHTFSTLLLDSEVSIRVIQSILGHASISTTQIYTHVNTKQQKQALLTKHPRKLISDN